MYENSQSASILRRVQNQQLTSAGETWGAMGPGIPYDEAPASPESLAQVAPRLIAAALEVGELAEHLESSFGISVHAKDSENSKDQQPALMSQLKRVEAVLQRAVFALENINRHVNG